MKPNRIFLNSVDLLLCFVLVTVILIISPEISYATAPNDNLLIFYELDEINCGGAPPMTLGNFLKRTLAGEIGSFIQMEAIKANVIAARSFTISPQTANIYTHTDGQ